MVVVYRGPVEHQCTVAVPETQGKARQDMVRKGKTEQSWGKVDAQEQLDQTDCESQYIPIDLLDWPRYWEWIPDVSCRVVVKVN